MSERLLSVGLDVGTTSSQMILSELTVENQAGAFSVPQLEIAQRKILYRGDVHFTPLLGGDRVDAAALRQLIEEDYRVAGVRREDVDTGAIIITGETSRKENARAVLSELSGFAGDFVVATAGPHLESVLAAKGAGAVDYARRTGKQVLHMDIGGGTSNLALIEDGKIIRTGCMNVGGRLLKFDESGIVTYVSQVLDGICPLKVGQKAEVEQVAAVAEILVQALEMAAGLREKTELLEKLWTREIAPQAFPSVTTPVCALVRNDSEPGTISFSGGVADCIQKDVPWLTYGDMGPVLGQVIRKSRLCQGEYVLGDETIRATVIGAGCHSTQLSGSTVFYQNVDFPLQNVPVVTSLEALPQQETTAILALAGQHVPTYGEITRLAGEIAAGFGHGPVYVCLEQDMAKALGQALAVRLGKDRPILCIDRVKLDEESYLDVGSPVGPALTVVVKTLVLGR